MDQAGGILWDITKFLCGCAKKEADYIYDLQENLKSLEDKWEDLQCMKEDLKIRVDETENTGAMQRAHEINRWLKKVNDIRQEIMGIQAQGDKEIQDKWLSKCCPKNCTSSYRLGRKVTKMLENLDQLAAGGKRFGENFKIAHTIPPEPIEMPQDEVVGLDLMFNEVWKSIEEENAGIIGLYGMGGVGKTTLLKKINNEFGKGRLGFNFVKWVVVSKEPNLDSIMDNIRKFVGIGNEIWHRRNQDEKAGEIYKILKQKKFALLFDDIWDKVDLKSVGVPHPKETNLQSKVLFTTRLEDVCAKMQAERTFKVETLTEEEASKLFCMKVGEDTLRSDPRIPKLAKEMAKECKRLPLALIVVGSAMAGVKSVEAWEDSIKNLTSSSWTAPDLEKKVFSILKFSYDRLDEIQKCCFLYCALYPEDYEILVPDLIDKWMWEKFLCKDMTKSVQDMRGHGESVIEKLKLSCLLERVEDDLFMNRTVKMHDMIRDMALWIAPAEDNMELVQRILIMNGWEIMNVYPQNVTTPVLLEEDFISIQCEKNIKHMKRLRVLDVKLKGQLSEDICGLVSLDYLSLEMGESPEPMLFYKLQYLTNLKFLSLKGRTVMECNIPLGVLSRLQQLRVFRILDCNGIIYSEERRILEELESLPNIEELWIEIRSEDGLNKLLESTKLQSCIYRISSQVSYVIDEMHLSLVSMSKLKQLQQINFAWLNIRSEQYSTCCLTKLRRVKISLSSVTHATWLKYAPLLQELAISQCGLMEEVIKEEEATKDVDSSVFSSLVTMTLTSLPRLESINKAPLPFPSLKFITIVSCPKLKNLPFDSNSAKRKLTVIKGERNWWYNLEWDDPAAELKFRSKFKTTPNF